MSALALGGLLAASPPPSRRPAGATAARALWPDWRWMLLALWLLVAAVAVPAKAAPVPWNNQRVELSADNEALAPFLLRLFARLRIPAVASEAVSGRVSGNFNQRAEVLFRELADSYGLTWYYDGATMHLYALAEIESRMLALEPTAAGRMNKLLADLQILDARFPLRVAATEGYLVVSGPPRYLARIEETVAFLEGSMGRNTRPQAVRSFKLKHAWAADRRVVSGGIEVINPGVASLLQAVLADGEVSNVGRVDQHSLPSRATGLLGQGLAGLGRQRGAEGLPGGAITERAPAARAGGMGELAAGVQPALPARTALERVSAIRADPRTNAIIVRDYAERIPLYEELINALDQPLPLIEIEATVIDISSDHAQSLGVDFGLLLSNRDGGAQQPRVAIDSQRFDPALTPRASVVLGGDRSFLFAQLNALQQEGAATVQSKPRVLTVDNNEAVLSSTQEFFVRVPGREVADLYNVSVGLTLRVTPSLVPDPERVRFKLQVHIDDGAVSTSASVDGVPQVQRSSVSAHVLVDEGESLFLGGLLSEVNSSGLRGVPGVSKAPLLGWLFGTRTSQVRKVERMFLLTPRLVKEATR